MPAFSRYLTLSQANVDHSHIYLTDCMDIFPPDAVGGANKSDSAPRTVRVQFGSAHVDTDIDGNKHIFRERGWVRRFFTENGMAAGDRVFLEQLGPYVYRVSKDPCLALHCLSIQQPWADLILDGKKRVENRSWPWKNAQRRLQNGQKVWLGVHVSKTLSIWKNEKCQNLAPGWTEGEGSVPGEVVGVVRVMQICGWNDLSTKLQQHAFTDHNNYDWHWVLARPHRLAEPIKWTGNVFIKVDIPRRLLPAELRDQISEE